jgi:hypothetical protein
VHWQELPPEDGTSKNDGFIPDVFEANRPPLEEAWEIQFLPKDPDTDNPVTFLVNKKTGATKIKRGCQPLPAHDSPPKVVKPTIVD